MSLRAVILFKDKDVFVEFPPDVFRELLQEYLTKYKSLDKALDRIEFDLKQKTRYR